MRCVLKMVFLNMDKCQRGNVREYSGRGEHMYITVDNVHFKSVEELLIDYKMALRQPANPLERKANMVLHT